MKKFLLYGKQFMLASLICTSLLITSCDDGDDPEFPDPAAPVATIDAVDQAQGTVTCTPISKFGDEVTITVTPNEGYVLDKLLIGDKDVTKDVKDGKYTITYLIEDITVKASFKAVGEGGDTPTPQEPAKFEYDAPYTITYSALWAAPSISVGDDWKELTVEFDAVPENVQFCVVSDAEYEESWGKAYRSTYPQITAASATINLEELLAQLQKDFPEVTKIVAVNLQNTADYKDGASYTTSVSAILATKKDDSKVLVDMPTSVGGAEVKAGEKKPAAEAKLEYDPIKTITFKGQYAAPTVAIDATWKELTVSFAEQPSDIQFCVTSDAVEKEESWGTAYYATYPQVTGETTTLDLAALLTELQGKSSNVTKIVTVGIQYTAKPAEGETYSTQVKAVVATKADGTKELVNLTPDWGSEIK